VFIEKFAAGPWATNCYLVAPAVASEAIIIDPGYESLAEIAQLVEKNQLHPVAALLTHGHMDHVWSVVPLCKSHNISAWIHEKDEWMIKEPAKAYSNEGWREILRLADNQVDFYPKDLNLIKSNQSIDLAGLNLTPIHSPGHTMGSLMFQIEQVLFSGDTLFNRGIGRTDLPGGDESLMRNTLKNVVLPMNDQIKVYPGHGPHTTIADERQNNIYLRELTK
jgi:hydroxyacylglutathione hydrolase